MDVLVQSREFVMEMQEQEPNILGPTELGPKALGRYIRRVIADDAWADTTASWHGLYVVPLLTPGSQMLSQSTLRKLGGPEGEDPKASTLNLLLQALNTSNRANGNPEISLEDLWVLLGLRPSGVKGRFLSRKDIEQLTMDQMLESTLDLLHEIAIEGRERIADEIHELQRLDALWRKSSDPKRVKLLIEHWVSNQKKTNAAMAERVGAGITAQQFEDLRAGRSPSSPLTREQVLALGEALYDYDGRQLSAGKTVPAVLAWLL
jgi:hypothetical protein